MSKQIDGRKESHQDSGFQSSFSVFLTHSKTKELASNAASSPHWFQSDNRSGSGENLKKGRDSSINWDGLVEEVLKKEIGELAADMKGNNQVWEKYVLKNNNIYVKENTYLIFD